MEMRGLMCGILEPKHIGNCSNGGLSSNCSRVVVLGVRYLDGSFKSIGNVFSPSPDAPAVVIEERMPCGRQYFTAYPCDENGVKFPGWFMDGGCFIETSDSRFSEVFRYPVPLHDRQESEEQSRTLSI